MYKISRRLGPQAVTESGPFADAGRISNLFSGCHGLLFPTSYLCQIEFSSEIPKRSILGSPHETEAKSDLKEEALVKETTYEDVSLDMR
jgi:hypothetical protein